MNFTYFRFTTVSFPRKNTFALKLLFALVKITVASIVTSYLLTSLLEQRKKTQNVCKEKKIKWYFIGVELTVSE